MKRFSLLAIAALFGIWNCFAIETIVDGIKYSLNTENKTAEVIQNSYSYSGNIVIPASIEYEGERFNVTSIREGAFAFSGIVSISLPEGITSIKKETFRCCNGLSRIILPHSLRTIEQQAFQECGLFSIIIPTGVTTIEAGAFWKCSYLSIVDLPETLTSIDGMAFLMCGMIQSFICRAIDVPEVTNSSYFVYPRATLSVPVTSINAYKAAEGWSSFNTIESISYLPFVEAGKLWRVHGFNMGSSHTVTDYYFSNEDEAETIDGHTYLKMYAKTGEETTLVGLFREENQRVYLYKKDAGREFLTYDFSLEEGDRFSPEYGDYSLCEVKEVSYKDVNGERLKVITFEANDRQIDADVRTQVEWIEGIGHSGGSDPSPLAGLYSKNSPPNSWGYYTAYVLYDNTQDNNYYLPLTFGVPYNGWWGQQPLNTVKMLSLDNSDPELHYELVPDPAHDCYQLHVYGNAIMNCGPNHYAYCIRENGNKLRIQIDDLEPLMDCTGPHHVELYFPFFLAEQHYTVVDERGEHPVTVKQETQTTYRPFIEEGKVWKVGSFPWGLNPDEWDWDEAQIVGTYYFDGDTIVGNQQCKKMMCRYEYGELGINWGGIPSTEYEGALYELDRKVYLAYPNQETFVLLYDFAASEGNYIEFYDTEKQQETNAIIGTKKQSESEKFHGIETELYIKVKDSHQYAYLNYEVNWREGIGYNCLQNTEEFERIGGARKFLMSCYIGDEVLYYDSTLKDGTITDSEVKKNWLDFTHTVKTKPKAPRRGEAAASDEETVTGEYSIKELFVNFKTLTGPYTITVLDAAGQPIYNKVVQTSNVVALNTDISTYAKGSYTITVENEDEAYSAEFLISDEDGLTPQPPLLQRGGEAGAVYNLNGQRLTKPQRGVNIVNGHKVVVK